MEDNTTISSDEEGSTIAASITSVNEDLASLNSLESSSSSSSDEESSEEEQVEEPVFAAPAEAARMPSTPTQPFAANIADSELTTPISSNKKKRAAPCEHSLWAQSIVDDCGYCQVYRCVEVVVL